MRIRPLIQGCRRASGLYQNLEGLWFRACGPRVKSIRFSLRASNDESAVELACLQNLHVVGEVCATLCCSFGHSLMWSIYSPILLVPLHIRIFLSLLGVSRADVPKGPFCWRGFCVGWSP